MLASILLMLSFGVALAAKENMTMSANESMPVNKTPDNMPLSVIMIPKDIMTAASDNMTAASDNMTAASDNMTMPMLDNKSISDNKTMSMPMKMPMTMSMPMDMPMSMPKKTTDVPMNIVILQNVTVNIITIMPLNMSNA